MARSAHRVTRRISRSSSTRALERDRRSRSRRGSRASTTIGGSSQGGVTASEALGCAGGDESSRLVCPGEESGSPRCGGGDESSGLVGPGWDTGSPDGGGGDESSG